MNSKLKLCPNCLSENDLNVTSCNNCGFNFENHSEIEFDIDVFYNIDDLIDDAILIFKGENYQESLELIEEYIEYDFDDEHVWALKSHILAKLGYLNDAIICCDIALNIDEMCEVAWSSKAYHYYIMKNFDASLSCCHAALLLDSKDDYINNLIESISSKTN